MLQRSSEGREWMLVASGGGGDLVGEGFFFGRLELVRKVSIDAPSGVVMVGVIFLDRKLVPGVVRRVPRVCLQL